MNLWREMLFIIGSKEKPFFVHGLHRLLGLSSNSKHISFWGSQVRYFKTSFNNLLPSQYWFIILILEIRVNP